MTTIAQLNDLDQYDDSEELIDDTDDLPGDVLPDGSVVERDDDDDDEPVELEERGPVGSGEYETLPLTSLLESPHNNRKHFDQAKLEQLADNIKKLGVLTPLLARPAKLPGQYELAAGHRRFRAAQMAGITHMPVVVRDMDDVTFLEVLNIENLQRDDLHPLEEADGYHDLMQLAGYTAKRIADRIGKSEKYVYDRVKLRSLIPDAKALFLDGKITAGHAILIARLSKDVQKTVIDTDDVDRNGSTNAPLWQSEHAQYHPLFGRDEDDDRLKAKSVRELEAWIEDHVRISPKDRDPLIFPELSEVVGGALEMNLKVVPITYEHVLKDSARSETEKTYGPQSWERADGKHKSKTCDFAITGYVAAGAGRGEAFAVCIAKEKCKTHWPEHVKRAEERKRLAKKLAAAEAKKPSASAAEKADRERKALEAQQAKEKAEKLAAAAEKKRFKGALPELAKRLAAHVKSLRVDRKGGLGKYLLEHLGDMYLDRAGEKLAEKYFGGASGDELVRYIVFADLYSQLDNEWRDLDDKVAELKSIGFDLVKHLNEVAPPPELAKKPAAKSAKKRR